MGVQLMIQFVRGVNLGVDGEKDSAHSSRVVVSTIWLYSPDNTPPRPRRSRAETGRAARREIRAPAAPADRTQASQRARRSDRPT